MHFGCKKVAYLGFHLTEEGIKPGSNKLKTVAAANPLVNVSVFTTSSVLMSETLIKFQHL